jgi:hypothetical protein
MGNCVLEWVRQIFCLWAPVCESPTQEAHPQGPRDSDLCPKPFLMSIGQVVQHVFRVCARANGIVRLGMPKGTGKSGLLGKSPRRLKPLT